MRTRFEAGSRSQQAGWAIVLLLATFLVPAVGQGNAPAAVLSVVAAYLSGHRLASLRLSVSMLGAGILAAGALRLAADPSGAASRWLLDALVVFAAVVIPWWWGRYRMLRRAQRRREHEVVAANARLLERSRIAQDMHDELGHELALIALGAGALEVHASSTEQGRRAAAEIRERASQAIDSLHGIVAMLRQEDSNGAAPMLPAGESIRALVQRVRTAGLRTDLEQVPAPPGTPEPSRALQAAMHRVVQEGLTNAAKHAPGAAVRIGIDEGGDPVTITVENRRTSPAPAVPTGGSGLAGVAERLRMLGGTLEAGTHGQDFRLVARIPRSAAPREPAPAAGIGPLPPADAPVAGALADLRRNTRSRQWASALLPLGLAVLLAGILVTVQVLTVVDNALAPAAYAQLSVGQDRVAVASLLPAGGLDGPTPLLAEPPVPEDTTCRYFLARSGFMDLSSDMYRLCFGHGVLVSKDHLLPREEG
ncbi:hypothetical protein KRR55_08495 [Paeniglutamicibacter sp. ABSL32-1]|uniref:sensor histidine kinase n=1 Tax=Paeniglutamicibacter quisquiliarum TaxID=2849498 RepID=UPI001C2DBA30|nr:histidine kinase [Paeniglutamicibacter quisquiliarum]MBV1779149.1 hypothetical protein [Paeniglutamicibacter quisquiliarum]